MTSTPEIKARPARPDEIPKNAVKLAELAGEWGWTATTWYARGKGRQPRVLDLVVVRLVRDGHRMVGIWHDGQWHAGVNQDPLVAMNQTELKAAVATKPEDFKFVLQTEEDDLRENMRDEFKYTGFYISGHPLDFVNMGLFPDVVDVSELYAMLPNGHYVWDEGDALEFVGLVEELKIKHTKRGRNPFATFMLSDRSGAISCVAFGEGYEQMTNGLLIWVRGKVSERQELREFRVDRARELLW